ncbi:MAG: glycosyltransferase [Candidatus Staskawiczbacteria bacterium]|nr:glycosyltransferase [Candidatus Staskawiczbacteria bacterium]
MENKKISIVIPARNEEKFIQKTIESLKSATVCPLEIIVVVNGSEDKTFKIAKQYATKALNFSEALGPSAARNKGAKIATGEILIFLDADTEVSVNTIREILKNFSFETVGVCSAEISEKLRDKKLRAKIFFAFKNFLHRAKFHKGSIALIFCSKEVFLRINGFDEDMWVGELNDFIKRALESGAKYKFLGSCYVVTSLRRYEKKWGYLKTILFWVAWKIMKLFGRDQKIKKDYYKLSDK